MKPVDQTKFGMPDGNCFAACVATIFDLPLEAVPHFMHLGEGWFEPFRRWSVDVLGHDVLIITPGSEKYFAAPLIVSGPAARGVDHSTVWERGNMFHDPHPSRAGLISVNDLVAFVPLRPRSSGFGDGFDLAGLEASRV
jgi:hypothetical protein